MTSILTRTMQMVVGGDYGHPLPPAPALTTEQKERMLGVYREPEPVPASVQLRRNLERASASYTNRENVLIREIADREAELADVRRAKGAVDTALIDLHVGDELAVEVSADD